MSCKESKPNLSEGGSSSDPFIVDLSPSCSGQSIGGLAGKMGGSVTVLPLRKEARRHRIKPPSCASASRMSCCVVALVVCVVIGQFVWSLSMQLSLLRVLDKLQAVEKLADTALDLTTDVATSAAKTAAHAAEAANKAVEAVITRGLTGIQDLSTGIIQNLTNADTLLAAAMAAKQQAQAAAAAAREYANAATQAKQSAIEAASAAKQQAEEVASDLEAKFKSALQSSLDGLKGIIPGVIARDVPGVDEPVTGPSVVFPDVPDKGEPVESPGELEGTTGRDSGSRSEGFSKGKEPYSQASDIAGVASNAGSSDDIRGRDQLEAGRSKRSTADDEEENEPNLRGHGRRSRTVKTSAVHFKLRVNVSDEQLSRLSSRQEPYITLQHGRITPEGYFPNEDADGGHVYKEWAKSEREQSGRQLFRFEPDRGHVIVHREGMYHVYGQILYRNVAVRGGFSVKVRRHPRWSGRRNLEAQEGSRGREEEEEDEELTACITSKAPSAIASAGGYYAPTTCHTSATIHLYPGDSVYISDIYRTPIASGTDGASFFGLFKIAEP